MKWCKTVNKFHSFLGLKIILHIHQYIFFNYRNWHLIRKLSKCTGKCLILRDCATVYTKNITCVFTG